MNKLHIEGTYFNAEDFISDQIPSYFNNCDIRLKLYLFLKEWFSSNEKISLHTSGSTGKPKEILVSKSKMLESAAMTCGFFNLNKNDKALLCLSTDFIAGKMMVIRAIYSGMDLYPVDVTGHPLAETSTAIDFAAMIPLQVYNSLSTKIERERLSQIKNIIVGGGALDKELENSLKDLPNSIYSTYGMTETLSHVALRRINGVMADKYYTALPGININLSAEQTLIIDAPFISNELIITNDIAEINSNGSFRILGRKDNVINTGGVKVLAEEVEEKLKPYIKHNYSITSTPNTKLGEEIVLLIEKSENYNNLEYIIEKEITLSYQQPKKIYRVKSIPLTSSGKIDRVAIKILAQQINLVNNI